MSFRIVRRDTGDGGVLLFHLAADGRLVAASGIGPGASIARDFKVGGNADRPPGAPPREACNRLKSNSKDC